MAFHFDFQPVYPPDDVGSVVLQLEAADGGDGARDILPVVPVEVDGWRGAADAAAGALHRAVLSVPRHVVDVAPGVAVRVEVLLVDVLGVDLPVGTPARGVRVGGVGRLLPPREGLSDLLFGLGGRLPLGPALVSMVQGDLHAGCNVQISNGEWHKWFYNGKRIVGTAGHGSSDPNDRLPRLDVSG